MDKEKNYAYLKIYFYLLDKISSEEYSVGSLIPTQIELSEKFKVSRLTVREAIKELTRRGLLHSIKGHGTVVIAKPLKINNDMQGFSNTLENNGENIVNSKVLCIKTMPADKDVAAKLKVPPSTPVVYISRIRYVNGEPVAIQDAYFLHNFVKDIDFHSEDLTSGSLYSLLKNKAGIVFYYVDEEYHAVICPKEIAGYLEIAEGIPIIKSVRVAYNSANIPIEYNENYGSSVVYRTVLRMKPNYNEMDSQYFLDKICGSLSCAVLGGAMGTLTEGRCPENIKNDFGGYIDDLQFLAGSYELGSATEGFSETVLKALKKQEEQETEDETIKETVLKAAATGLFAHQNVDEVIDNIAGRHNNVSLSGAAAIAASVHKAMQPNSTIGDVISAGIYGAARGSVIAGQKGVYKMSASIEKRIKLAVFMGANGDDMEKTMLELRDVIGTSMLETELIPLVFGIIAANKGNAMGAVKMAVNIGGAASVVAATVGAIIGALYGIESVPEPILERISEGNPNIEGLAEKIYNTGYEEKR